MSEIVNSSCGFVSSSDVFETKVERHENSKEIENIQQLKVNHRQFIQCCALAFTLLLLIMVPTLWKLIIFHSTPIDFDVTFDKTTNYTDTACPFSIHTLKLTHPLNEQSVYFNISSVSTACVSQKSAVDVIPAVRDSNRLLQNYIAACFTNMQCLFSVAGNILQILGALSHEVYLLAAASSAVLILLAS